MNIIKQIRSKIPSKAYIVAIERQSEKNNKYFVRKQYLLDKILSCTDSGVTDKRYCNHEIVVSLTTYGKRLYDVAFTIESIMQGTMKPNRIVLWLGDELKDTPLPITLQRQQKRGLEISFCKDIRSYKKLIPTLYKYPKAAVITIDDDILYHFDLVENLVNAHIQSPRHIIADRIHRIVLGDDKRPVSYMKWEWNARPQEDSVLNFFTGGGGTLYPPHSLHPEVMNEAVFCKICTYADDIWFNAMAMKAGTHVKKCFIHDRLEEDHLVNEDVQDVGLCRINTDGTTCANDSQLKAVFDKYDLWSMLL